MLYYKIKTKIQTKVFILSSYLLLYLIFSLTTLTQNALSHELSLGIAATEPGDSLYRPAISLHLGIKNIHIRGHYHERSFGPVKENFFIINIHNMFVTPFYKSLSAGYGISYLQQRTILSFSEEKDLNSNRDETNKNLGFLLGFYWSWFAKNPYFIRLGWEANIFPVGLSTIVLVTARQQVLFLESGFYL